VEIGAALDLLKFFVTVSAVRSIPAESKTKLLQKRQGKIQQFKCGTILPDRCR
jgi:hypothetical protein